jgi:hypothetical protein
VSATTPPPDVPEGFSKRLGGLVAAARPLVVEAVNKSVPGTITLHYKSRDVVVDVPGDVALRMMVVFRRARADGLDDPIDLASSSALCGWVSIGTRGLLAITWAPGVDAADAVDEDMVAFLDAAEDPEAAAVHLADILDKIGWAGVPAPDDRDGEGEGDDPAAGTDAADAGSGSDPSAADGGGEAGAP